ncbi:hypothetical protein ENBRE01_0571 [Enteropsectra breve]|nr:hypothetical protein ENBRE01_0571 [Enteropsectra breve]
MNLSNIFNGFKIPLMVLMRVFEVLLLPITLIDKLVNKLIPMERVKSIKKLIHPDLSTKLCIVFAVIIAIILAIFVSQMVCYLIWPEFYGRGLPKEDNSPTRYAIIWTKMLIPQIISPLIILALLWIYSFKDSTAEGFYSTKEAVRSYSSMLVFFDFWIIFGHFLHFVGYFIKTREKNYGELAMLEIGLVFLFVCLYAEYTKVQMLMLCIAFKTLYNFNTYMKKYVFYAFEESYPLLIESDKLKIRIYLARGTRRLNKIVEKSIVSKDDTATAINNDSTEVINIDENKADAKDNLDSTDSLDTLIENTRNADIEAKKEMLLDEIENVAAKKGFKIDRILVDCSSSRKYRDGVCGENGLWIFLSEDLIKEYIDEPRVIGAVLLSQMQHIKNADDSERCLAKLIYSTISLLAVIYFYGALEKILCPESIVLYLCLISSIIEHASTFERNYSRCARELAADEGVFGTGYEEDLIKFLEDRRKTSDKAIYTYTCHFLNWLVIRNPPTISRIERIKNHLASSYP